MTRHQTVDITIYVLMNTLLFPLFPLAVLYTSSNLIYQLTLSSGASTPRIIDLLSSRHLTVTRHCLHGVVIFVARLLVNLYKRLSSHKLHSSCVTADPALASQRCRNFLA